MAQKSFKLPTRTHSASISFLDCLTKTVKAAISSVNVLTETVSFFIGDNIGDNKGEPYYANDVNTNSHAVGVTAFKARDCLLTHTPIPAGKEAALARALRYSNREARIPRN